MAREPNGGKVRGERRGAGSVRCCRTGRRTKRLALNSAGSNETSSSPLLALNTRAAFASNRTVQVRLSNLPVIQLSRSTETRARHERRGERQRTEEVLCCV